MRKHDYPGGGYEFTSDCTYGCGSFMGPSTSGGPDGVDPFGPCPKAPPAKPMTDRDWQPNGIKCMANTEPSAEAWRLLDEYCGLCNGTCADRLEHAMLIENALQRKLLLQFIGSLTLADHLGDVSNEISEVLTRIGIDLEWDDLDALGTELARIGVTTLYDTSLGEDGDE